MNEGRKTEPEWASAIPGAQWAVYLDAIRATRKTGARFLLGGAFGLAAYTGRWRNTKDLDFFVLPSEKDRVVDALTKLGFEDYHPTLPYDRAWIYRAVRDEVIVDTIWQTPNRRSEVDPVWFERAGTVTLRGERLGVIPAEEMLVIKLFVLQRDRCDWPDLINLLYTVADRFDWDHVLARLGEDAPLLAGLLQVFSWVAPAQAARLPADLRKRFALQPTASRGPGEEHRIRLLDSRNWFAAHQPPDQPMQL
jgi:hypothetical protein